MSDKTIGRYTIQKELGRGGMATVYLAVDPHFQRQVAVKMLPQQFSRDASFRARFEQEARTIARLEHPAIVPVYDFGQEKEQLFLVMRYMPGGSLLERVTQEPLSLFAAAKVTRRIAAALDDVHRRDIIHRDLKPDNILFDLRDNAYLSDFGIVKLAQSALTFADQTFMGTPAYMSPEQARGTIEIDSRSDVYSLGVILFEMLTGQLPFQADTPVGMALMHVADPIPQIRQLKGDLPPNMQLIIDRALAKARVDRYATAGELAQDLVALVRATPGTIPKSGTASRHSEPRRSEPRRSEPRRSEPRPPEPQHRSTPSAPPTPQPPASSRRSTPIEQSPSKLPPSPPPSSRPVPPARHAPPAERAHVPPPQPAAQSPVPSRRATPIERSPVASRRDNHPGYVTPTIVKDKKTQMVPTAIPSLWLWSLMVALILGICLFWWILIVNRPLPEAAANTGIVLTAIATETASSTATLLPTNTTVAAMVEVGETAVSSSPTPRLIATATATEPPTATNTLQPTATTRATNTPVSVATTAPSAVEVIFASVNVRVGPGTVYGDIGFLSQGERATVIAQTEDGSWYNVRLANGRLGWVAANVVRPIDNTDPDDIPIVLTIPPAPTRTPTPIPSPTSAPDNPPPSSGGGSSGGGGPTKTPDPPKPDPTPIPP